jgi:hypothetical protein
MKGVEMNATELNNILSEHSKWLADNKTGRRADLRDADLCGANLRYADLSNANLSNANLCDADLCGANLRYADLRYADLSNANLSNADLSNANLSNANLCGANLRGADLDYSCWPLSCGSNHVTVDARIAAQLAAHFCVLDCDDKDYQKARKAILEFAKTSHRAGDLGLLEETK